MSDRISWNISQTALAAKDRHDRHVHLIAPVPSFIHCSAVPRWLYKGDDVFRRSCQVGVVWRTNDSISPFIIPADKSNGNLRLIRSVKIIERNYAMFDKPRRS
jgi:hypothetical protein